MNCFLVYLQDIVMGLKFGQFGREDGSLLMITQGGSPLEDFDDEGSPLSDQQQGAVFTTKLTKLQPHHNVL